MRSHRIFGTVFSLTALAVAIVALSGCSSSDNKTGSGEVNINYDPLYPVVSQSVNQSVGEMLELAQNGFEATVVVGRDDFNSDDPNFGPQPPDSVVTGNMWTVLYSSFVQASVSRTKVDSIQFRKNDIGQDTHEGADEVAYRNHSSQIPGDTSVTYTSFTKDVSLDITNLDQDQATVNGTAAVVMTKKLVTSDSTANYSYDITVTMASLVVNRGTGNWNDGCPTSGTVTVTVDLTYHSNRIANAQSSWSYTMTITDGQAEVDVTEGSQTASYSNQLCVAE